MQITSQQALYNAVYDGLIDAKFSKGDAHKWADLAKIRYRKNEFESPSQLIEDTLEDAIK